MSEWRSVPLGENAEITMGQSPDSTAVSGGESGMPFLQGCAEFGARSPRAKVRCNPPLRVGKKGSVLISVRAPVGTTNYADQDYCIGRGLGAVAERGGISDSRFLLYAIEQNVDFLHRRSQGSTFAAIGSRELSALPIPLLKLSQQRRIATILTTLEEVIEATEKLVEKHQQIKAGLMHDLFTRGLWTRPELARGDHQGLPCEATAQDGQLRPTPEEAPGLYQDSPLGLIPKAWKVELLDALAKRGSGHTPNRHTPNFWDGGIKWVSLADSANLDQLYLSETEKEISLLGIENSSAVLHPAGIVVLSRDAGVGKSAITTCPMAVSQHFMCWLCGPELDNHYLYYWLQDQKRVFENISTGTTIPTIGLGFFRRYKIAVPTNLDEQQKIRGSLLSSDESIFALQNDLAKLRQQKQGLMHDLLTGLVRVE